MVSQKASDQRQCFKKNMKKSNKVKSENEALQGVVCRSLTKAVLVEWTK